MSYVTGFNTQQTADLLALIADYNNGNLATLTAIQALIMQQSANFGAFASFVEVTVSDLAPATADIQRRGKISYNELTCAGAATSLDQISEGTTFEDGDIVIMKPATGKTITLNTLDTTIRLKDAGNYLAIIRAGGSWSILYSNPPQPVWIEAASESSMTILSTDTSITPESSLILLDVVTGGTAAAAVYEITAAGGTDGILSLYVDFNLIATGQYTSATTIDLLGAAVVAGALPGIPFSITYNAGTNRLTITDTINLGAAGNALVLGDAVSGGVTGTIITAFAGGVDGVEAAATIDTVGSVVSKRILRIFNANTANDTSKDVKANSPSENENPCCILSQKIHPIDGGRCCG